MQAAWVFLTGAQERREKSTLSYRDYLMAAPSKDVDLLRQYRDGIALSWRNCHPAQRRAFDDKDENAGGILNILAACKGLDHELNFHPAYCAIIRHLLIQLQAQEAAFWVFVSMLDEYGIRRAVLSQAGERKHVFKALYSKHCSTLAGITEREDVAVDVTGEITPWLVSAFGEGFAPSTVGRIWDIFFHEKEKALHRFALAFLQMKTASLLEQNSLGRRGEQMPDNIRDNLQELPHKQFDSNSVVEVSLKVSVTTEQVESLRRTYIESLGGASQHLLELMADTAPGAWPPKPEVTESSTANNARDAVALMGAGLLAQGGKPVSKKATHEDEEEDEEDDDEFNQLYATGQSQSKLFSRKEKLAVLEDETKEEKEAVEEESSATDKLSAAFGSGFKQTGTGDGSSTARKSVFSAKFGGHAAKAVASMTSGLSAKIAKDVAGEGTIVGKGGKTGSKAEFGDMLESFRSFDGLGSLKKMAGGKDTGGNKDKSSNSDTLALAESGRWWDLGGAVKEGLGKVGNVMDDAADAVGGVKDKVAGSWSSVKSSVTSSRDSSRASTPSTGSSFLTDPLSKLGEYDFSKDFEKAMFSFGDDSDEVILLNLS